MNCFSFISPTPMFLGRLCILGANISALVMAGCQMKSIIVDDEPTSQKILEKMLSELGECRTAPTPMEAVRQIADAYDSQEPFRLVCLDIMMPDCDGYSVLSQIRELEAKRGILGLDGVKVVMVSSLGDKASILKAFRSGCEGYVVKPVERRKLLETISSLGFVGLESIPNSEAKPDDASSVVIEPDLAAQETAAPGELNEEVRIFLVESYELIERIEGELVELEKSPDNADLIKSIFRSVHTIKGNSGFLNLTTLETICHRGEALLDKIRSRVMSLTPEASQALMSMTDILGRTLRRIEGGQGDAVEDAPKFIAVIESLVGGV